jgi:predicted nucleic acid-binding protein
MKYANISMRDAIHAASMQNNGHEKILSADSHFDNIEEIERVDPLKFSFSD